MPVVVADVNHPISKMFVLKPPSAFENPSLFVVFEKEAFPAVPDPSDEQVPPEQVKNAYALVESLYSATMAWLPAERTAVPVAKDMTEALSIS